MSSPTISSSSKPKLSAKSISKPTSTSTNPNDSIRLHITPLTPSLLTTLLPRSLFPPSYPYPPEVSYHTLPTFPDKSYGYLTLPSTIAAALKKRFHNTVFRGVTVQIATARKRKWEPDTLTTEEMARKEKAHEEDVAEEVERRVRREKKRERKERKKVEGVLEGVMLEEGRWVKRAWAKAGGKEGKKEGARRGECLFNVSVPSGIPADAATELVNEKMRKTKDKKKAVLSDSESEAEPAPIKSREHRKKEKKLLKEFSHTTKFPQFLKSSQLDPNNKSGKAVNFVDGVGWVDADGNGIDDSAVKSVTERQKRKMMEEELRSKKARKKAEDSKVKGAKMKVPRSKSTSESESDGDSSAEDEDEAMVDANSASSNPASLTSNSGDSEASEDESDAKSRPLTKSLAKPLNDTKQISTSGSSASDSSHSSRSYKEESDEEAEIARKLASTSSSPSASSSPDSDTGDDDSASDTNRPQQAPPTLTLSIPGQRPLNPLEAIFKPTSTTNHTDTKALFTFTNSDSASDSDASEQEDELPDLPHPSTRRSHRSAAPTPDTAVVGKNVKWPDPRTVRFPPQPQTISYPPPSTELGEAPLLFQAASANPFLQGLSIWGGNRLPVAKSVTEMPVEEEPEEAEGGRVVKRRRGNANEVGIGAHKKRNVGMEEGEVKGMGGSKDEVWKERFYAKRGEWNREWKGKRKEAGKVERRKRREKDRGVGRGGGVL